MREVCLLGRGGGRWCTPPILIICALTVCCRALPVFQADLHEGWESLNVCMPERGNGHQEFPVYEQHGYLLLPTLVNVIGYFFFVFFFTCTVHKIKYTSNTCAVVDWLLMWRDSVAVVAQVISVHIWRNTHKVDMFSVIEFMGFFLVLLKVHSTNFTADVISSNLCHIHVISDLM